MQSLSKRQRLLIMKSDLDSDYNTFYQQYKDLNDYFLPSRGRFVLSQDSNRGDRRNHKIIDPTGYLAARTLGSGMQAGANSPARPWFRLSTPDPMLAEFGPVREWLDIVYQRMSTYFLRSNLYNVLPTAYEDLGVFGSAAIFMDKDKDTVSRFKSFPIGSYRIATDFRGRVNTFYREFRMTVRQLVDEFGRYDEKGKPDWSGISRTVRTLYEKSNYQTWIDVCHIIEPNELFNPRGLSSKFKRFASTYYELNSNEGDGEKYLRESGYDYFPVLCPRWKVTGMDAYGTDCPGMASIGDNKQLQHGEKRAAQAIDKMINPALKASAGLKNSKVSLVSGDITFMDDMNDSLEAIHQVGLDLSHLEKKQEQCRERINKAFFVDLFMPILSDPRSDRTATEINQIKDERMLAVGPVLEQLKDDGHDPLVDNQFFLMVEAGLLPPAPKELEGMPLKVEYTSVLAQAQKIAGIAALDRVLNLASMVTKVDPTALAKFDIHQYIDEYADALGTPAKIIRADDEVKKMLDQQRQAQQQQAQLESLGQVTGAAKQLSETNLDNDSALSRLLQQGNAGQLVQQSI